MQGQWGGVAPAAQLLHLQETRLGHWGFGLAFISINGQHSTQTAITSLLAESSARVGDCH